MTSTLNRRKTSSVRTVGDTCWKMGAVPGSWLDDRPHNEKKLDNDESKDKKDKFYRAGAKKNGYAQDIH